MRLPIDTTNLAFICAGEVQPVVDFETRRAKTDENGVPLYQVALVAMGDVSAEVINLKVAGQPTGLTAGSPVRLIELVAIPWSIDGNTARYSAENGVLKDRLALSVEEAGMLLGISRDLAYDLVNCRELPSVRLGRRLVVPRRALEDFLENAIGTD